MDYTDKFPEVEKLNGKKAIFLLGTDQYIGEGLDENGTKKESETRVGIVPDQVAAIKKWLESNGIALDFFFVKGAGTRADFLDSAYIKIGGQLLFEHQLSTMPIPSVVHALKEPCAYETFIPGPFMRIGALHTGAFDNGETIPFDETGMAFLLKRRNFCAIFDGSNIGTENNIPIRGAMSVFAGEIASEFSIKHFRENNLRDVKVIISGGGVAGKASLNEFLKNAKDMCSEIIVVEFRSESVELLKQIYINEPKVKIIQGSALSSEQVENANAIILTAFIKGKSAPEVLMFNDIKKMKPKSIIVNVSIDEGGSGIKLEDGDKNHEKITTEIENLSLNIKYIADDHLPKYRPKKASVAHGQAIMPYISMLLYCSAKLGGPRQAAKYIYNGDFSDQISENAKEILLHLRRGFAFYCPVPIKYNEAIIGEEKNKNSLESFFNNEAIEFDLFE